MPASTLTALLTGLTAAEKADRKAEALVDLLNEGEYKVGNKFVRVRRFTTFTRDGVTVDLVSAQYVSGCFGLVLDVYDARGPLPMPDYGAGEMYLFRNPPIRRWTRDPVVDADGNVTDPGETVEDIAALVQGFVYDAVIAYATNHGWTHG
jgi:hypothetical protein